MLPLCSLASSRNDFPAVMTAASTSPFAGGELFGHGTAVGSARPDAQIEAERQIRRLLELLLLGAQSRQAGRPFLPPTDSDASTLAISARVRFSPRSSGLPAAWAILVSSGGGLIHQSWRSPQAAAAATEPSLRSAPSREAKPGSEVSMPSKKSFSWSR